MSADLELPRLIAAQHMASDGRISNSRRYVAWIGPHHRHLHDSRRSTRATSSHNPSVRGLTRNARLYTLVYVERRFYNFFIDLDLAAGLKRIKKRDGISESEQIRRAIRKWLDSKGLKKTAPKRKRKGGKRKR